MERAEVERPEFRDVTPREAELEERVKHLAALVEKKDQIIAMKDRVIRELETHVRLASRIRAPQTPCSVVNGGV